MGKGHLVLGVRQGSRRRGIPELVGGMKKWRKVTRAGAVKSGLQTGWGTESRPGEQERKRFVGEK